MLSVFIWITWSVLLSKIALGSVFIEGTLSNKQERLDMGCLKYVGVMPHDILDCARECLLEDKCEGFCVDEHLKCYIHFHCKLLADSSDEVTYFQRLATEDDCLSGGTWQAQSQTCKCSGGLVGLRCERYAESCKELFQLGYPAATRRPFVIQPPGLDPFLTHCANFAGQIRTDIFFRSGSGLLKFNRSFTDYATGFYYFANEYWIGLEKMHVLNTLGSLSDVSFYITKNGTVSNQFHYRGVTIGNSSTGYCFNYSNVTYTEYGRIVKNATVSNCFPLSGASFSAPDTDNDAEALENCAEISGAGWWFSTCDPDPICNPLGLSITPGTVNLTRQHIMFRGLDLNDYTSQFLVVRMYLFEPWK